MGRAAHTLEIVRERCGADELLAYGVEQPLGYLYRGDVEKWDRIQVVGRTGAKRLEVAPSEVLGGAFYRVEIARLADLSEDERPGMITFHSGAGHRDPMVEELIALVKRGVAFNNDQDRVLIPLDQATLEENIANAASRRAEDAHALRAVAGIKASEEALEQRGSRFDNIRSPASRHSRHEVCSRRPSASGERHNWQPVRRASSASDRARAL